MDFARFKSASIAQVTSLIFRQLKKINFWLVTLFVLVFGWHSWSRPQLTQKLAPQTVYSMTLDMKFEQDAQNINITTFIPQTNSRQRVINESVNANAMAHSISESEQGRVAQWSGISSVNAVQYSALVAVNGIEYQIDDNLKITSIGDNSRLRYTVLRTIWNRVESVMRQLITLPVFSM